MQPGKVYQYFKPSYINGYASFYVNEQSINFEFAQVMDGGVCREELQIQGSKGLDDQLITLDVVNKNFESVFKRTTSNV